MVRASAAAERLLSTVTAASRRGPQERAAKKADAAVGVDRARVARRHVSPQSSASPASAVTTSTNAAAASAPVWKNESAESANDARRRSRGSRPGPHGELVGPHDPHVVRETAPIGSEG